MKREITFVHAADLHLGRRYRNLDPELAGRFLQDEPAVLARLIELCRQEEAMALVLPGDVFDTVRPDPMFTDMFFDMARELTADGIGIFIAPGNHDPLWPDSPWYSDLLPEGVHVFGTGPGSFAVRSGQADFYGAGFSGRSEKTYFTALELPSPDPERLSVLVLHAEIVSEGVGGRYRPISLQELKSLPFDYTALGHVHEPGLKPGLAADLPYAYSGSLFGRGFDETGPRGALVVRLQKTVERPLYAGEKPLIRLARSVQFMPLTRYTFFSHRIEGQGEAFDPAFLLEKLAAEAKQAGIRLADAVVKLTLTGDNGGERPSVSYLTRALEKHCLRLSLIDQSYAADDEHRLSEHGLRGAFLRRSHTVSNDDPRRLLARDLGLSAFAGPVDLSRFFEAEP